MADSISQIDLIKEFFINNPLRDIPHNEAVQWLLYEYKKRTGYVFADPDRGIRSLSQKGFLIKISKGVYRYDPDFVQNRKLEDFTPIQKIQILERDNFKCVICGRSRQDGVELHIDHIKAKDFGGKATIENGQTLYAQHNFLKKNFKQTETGKKMFIRLYELAKVQEDHTLQKFCTEILEVFEKNNINGHIEWKK
ncbi:MAG: HNH endonuclease [Bacteroidetes bacterium RIFCSPLOWO2_12_FULL_31_6]|nr:MAG: HNH endonuclease [Bacteroidetes bacterium RIFCSPLOWO2_12_FULL_31_6]